MVRASGNAVARLVGNGRYVLGEQLGAGGMGIVYAAEDLVQTERVAIKVAASDRLATSVIAEHMAREVRAGRATHHPNVVGVREGGIDNGQPFVVMELATGATLSAHAARERLSIARIAAIVDQILAGLGAIHAAGFVHGDMKSDNVLVTCDGVDRVKIIDLGLACEHAMRAPTAGERVVSGTPHYVAPELARGAGKAIGSDLYAVGVILYELLTGTPPFGGTDAVDILRKQVEEAIIPPSQRAPQLVLPLALESVVLRALDKDPRDRFASAAEFRAALQDATVDPCDAPISPHPFSSTAPTSEWTRPELPPSRVRALGTKQPANRPRTPHLVVEAALDATRALIAAHRLAAARSELEAALRVLDGDDSCDRVAWRLLLPLSAICDSLREPSRARRLARLALDSAARAGSDVGRRRAKALIERLVGRSRVLA